ncbi:MAG: YdiU family protein [Oligoflexia bacterium]|nr:YdiU family protein [Oligoflexia bacterium]
MNKSLNEAKWVNSYTHSLSPDPSSENHPREVQEHYSWVKPTRVPDPKLLLWNTQLGNQMALEKPLSTSELFYYSGNEQPRQAKPFAQNYGGHQFGHWANQLGDGRAITLGEITKEGQSWEIQLKGSGATPYSRRGDGKAVLRSSLREFYASELNYNLGVATTRALALVETGESVIRDLFYDGNPKEEPGAVLTRISSSFIRFGSFELFSYRRERDKAQKLFNYVLEKFYPNLIQNDNPVELFFETICTRTAHLIADWMRYGFVHGVMNTDNMSILGQTIDYGPYAWIEDFSLSFTPNTTDLPGRRYCYGRQPYIAQWNLERLAISLKDLGLTTEGFQKGIESYQKIFSEKNKKDFSLKLGFEKKLSEDEELKLQLFSLLENLEIDFTLFFRLLSKIIKKEIDSASFLQKSSYKKITETDLDTLNFWLKAYQNRMLKEERSIEDISLNMKKVNPAIIYRNYMTHLICEDLSQGTLNRAEELFAIIQDPFNEKWESTNWFIKRPDWANQTPGCTMLSCSS